MGSQGHSVTGQKLALTPIDVDAVQRLFESLGWAIDSGDVNTNRFELFCSMLAEMSERERQMILAISADFFAHGLALYDDSASSLLSQLLAAGVFSVKPVVLLPLQHPRDAGKPKSAGLSMYVMSNAIRRTLPPLTQWEAWDRLELINTQLPDRTQSTVVLVDDFIGSGRTARECIEFFRKTFARPTDRIVIASLVAQRKAIETLERLGEMVYVAHRRDRGISDSSRVEDPQVALTVMDGIEDRLDISSKYRRGFGEAEALVNMARCPNNTFPVFWASQTRTGAVWPCPFSR